MSNKNKPFTLNNSFVAAQTTEQQKIKKIREKYSLIGRNKDYIIIGSNDRVMGIPYDENKYSKKEDQQSYYYGYYIRGILVIEGIIDKLLNENKFDEIRQIGYREYNLGIKMFDINGKLVQLFKYKNYVDGYNEAKIKNNIENKRCR